ncbi:MFS transporter [Allostella vacuolata]|nr:MFS transporter [Stella vacuolata]
MVGLGFLALALAFSARGALSLAMPAWQAEFGWSREFVSGIAAVTMLVMAAVAPVAGNAVDRHGPRPLLLFGLAAIGAGIAMVAGAGEDGWLLPLGFAVVAGVGFGAVAQHVVAAAIALRFETRRGLATGIGTSGSTGGQLLMMPLLALLLQDGGWRSGFAGLAAGALVLLLATLVVLRPAAAGAAGKRARPASDPRGTGERLRFLAASPVFHALFWSFLLCGFTTSGVIETHLLPYAAICGFPPVLGATAYGVLSGVNLCGMILAGWLSDRMHRPLLLAVIYGGRALCFVLLPFIAGDYPLLLVFAVLFGLFDYATVPVTASLVASRLGLPIMGMAMGILSAGHAVGGAAGAFAGGRVFDLAGGYDALWFGSIALAGLAATLVAGLADPRSSGPRTSGRLPARA